VCDEFAAGRPAGRRYLLLLLIMQRYAPCVGHKDDESQVRYDQSINQSINQGFYSGLSNLITARSTRVLDGRIAAVGMFSNDVYMTAT